MKGGGSAHGKLILFGEHTAVYGAPAVGVALPFEIQIRLGNPWDEDLVASDAYRDESSEIEELLRKSGVDITPPSRSRWMVKNTVPRSGGFGSSAAFSTAIARTVLAKHNDDYDRDVHRLANKLESQFHGNPSGIDTGLASYPNLSAWFPVADDVPRPESLIVPELRLVYGALPRSGKTSESVGSIGRRRSNLFVRRVLDELGEISRGFIDFCGTANDSAGFQTRIAEMVSRAQILLDSLGLSTGDLDQVLSGARDLGALSGKLSGGGMGGAFFILAADQATQGRLVSELPPLLLRRNVKLSTEIRALTISAGKIVPG